MMVMMYEPPTSPLKRSTASPIPQYIESASNGINNHNQKKLPNGIGEGAKVVARDRSIDVLRGLCCFGMILVNTAGPVRPSWLSHPISIHQPITFADTLFPCFVFTSGLALAQRKSINSDNKMKSLRKLVVRAIKLNLIGIAYNNLIPRVFGFHQDKLFHFKSYRIPSVLGRIGISSVVCSLESFFNLKPPIFATFLGLLWYSISSLRPFEPLYRSSQAWFDQNLLGSLHLYDPKLGFDPEGILGSILTAPISSLLGSYVARPQFLGTIETPQLAAIGILGMLLTGLVPSPGSKLFWSPTFVGKTTSASLFYWSIARALIFSPKTISRLTTKPLEILGHRSLEIYLISTCVSMGLTKIGIWDSIFHLINHFLTLAGFSHDQTRQTVVGLLRSSLLGISMVPLAGSMIKLNWKL